MNPYFIQAEMDYRKEQTRKAIAAHRGSRSRASWLRRVAASEKIV